MIKVLEGFPDYGKQGESQSWTLNFENLPSGMDYPPLKVDMRWPNLGTTSGSLWGARVHEGDLRFESRIENPDMKMLKFLRDWMELAELHNKMPRYKITSAPKGAFVTFAAVPMLQLWFDSRRLAKVFAKNHDITFTHMGTKE